MESMEIDTLLRRLADEHVQEWDRPEEFQRAGDLTVAGSVVFSCPEPPEWYECGDVPPGEYPVYIGTVRRTDQESGDTSTFVTMVFVPLADPGAIGGAGFEDAAEDWQPLGAATGFLWDSTAMDSFRPGGTPPKGFADLDAFVAHVESELGTSGAAWVSVVADEETGANVLAFPVLDESALCFEAHDEDGKLLALLYTGSL
ncbi:hypothetical protein [Streptacidiphilus anmyonensis]|uniref:hypothetical protein n=1 Tax=Streptacidiphilus anmyonensis TaxID=405782 RepID=UPI0005A63C90|nr:hypothetical protein [Streptacidiphilus anmyonensis]